MQLPRRGSTRNSSVDGLLLDRGASYRAAVTSSPTANPPKPSSTPVTSNGMMALAPSTSTVHGRTYLATTIELTVDRHEHRAQTSVPFGIGWQPILCQIPSGERARTLPCIIPSQSGSWKTTSAPACPPARLVQVED